MPADLAQPSAVLGVEGRQPDQIPQIQHQRSIRHSLSHWWAICTCGWVSSGLLTPYEAQTVGCEVQETLAASAVRRMWLGVAEGQK